MAELNFGLLNPPGSQSIGNAFVQGMDQAAVARAQENQNALSQYTLSKARREDELTTQMLAGMQGANTIEQQADVLRRGGKYREANELLTSGLARQIKLGTLNAQPGAAARVAAQTARDRQQWEGQAIRDLGNNPSDDHIRALGQDAVRKEIYTQDQADQKVAEFLAVPLADRAAKFKQYGAAAPQQNQDPLAATIALRNKYPPGSPEYIALDAKITQFQDQNRVVNPVTGLIEDRRGGAPAPAPRGFVDSGIPQGVTPLLQAPSVDEARRQAIAMNAAGLPVNIRGGNALPGAQPQPQPPDVNALRAQPAAATTTTPSNPRQELENYQAVLALEKLGWRRTPEGNLEKISGGPADKTVVTRTPVQELKFRKDLATDYATTTATTQGMQDVLDSITDVKNSAGLAGATGIPGALYSLPGSQAAAAQTNLTNLKGKITSLGKTLANAEGKIGPMAVQEWTIVRDMVAALDTAVSKGEKITLDEIAKIEFTARNIAKRVQDRFEGQYGDELSNYPQFATVPEPKSRIKPAAIPQAAIDALNAGRGTPAQFDEQFGAGSAARVKGKK